MAIRTAAPCRLVITDIAARRLRLFVDRGGAVRRRMLRRRRVRGFYECHASRTGQAGLRGELRFMPWLTPGGPATLAGTATERTAAGTAARRERPHLASPGRGALPHHEAGPGRRGRRRIRERHAGLRGHVIGRRHLGGARVHQEHVARGGPQETAEGRLLIARGGSSLPLEDAVPTGGDAVQARFRGRAAERVVVRETTILERAAMLPQRPAGLLAEKDPLGFGAEAAQAIGCLTLDARLDRDPGGGPGGTGARHRIACLPTRWSRRRGRCARVRSARSPSRRARPAPPR